MVYLFLADGFEETEAVVPIDLLRRAQVEVITVGVGGSEVTITVKTDIHEDETLTEGLEMVVLPGGPGTSNLEKSEVVLKMLDFAAGKELWIGAICAAPTILGKKGLLKGKKAVCFPGCEKDLDGAIISSDSVCVDGKIITANGAGASLAFGLALVEALKGSRVAYEIGARIQAR